MSRILRTLDRISIGTFLLNNIFWIFKITCDLAVLLLLLQYVEIYTSQYYQTKTITINLFSLLGMDGAPQKSHETVKHEMMDHTEVEVHLRYRYSHFCICDGRQLLLHIHKSLNCIVCYEVIQML